MRTLPSSPDAPFPLVLASHAGFPCEAQDAAVFPAVAGARFVLPWNDDVADETAWGAPFALRMQDPALRSLSLARRKRGRRER